MSRDSNTDKNNEGVDRGQNPDDFQLLVTPRLPRDAVNKSTGNPGKTPEEHDGQTSISGSSGSSEKSSDRLDPVQDQDTAITVSETPRATLLTSSSTSSEQGKVCLFVLGNLLIILGSNRFLLNENAAGYVLLGASALPYAFGFSRDVTRAIEKVSLCSEPEGVAKFLTGAFLNSLAASNLFFLVGMKDASVYLGPALGFVLTPAVKFVIQKWDPGDIRKLKNLNGLIPPAFINFVGSAAALSLTTDVQNMVGGGIAIGSFVGLLAVQFKFKKDSPLSAIAQLVSMIPVTTLAATAIRALPAWTAGIHPVLSIATIATSPLISMSVAYGATHLLSKGVAKWLPKTDPRPHAIFGVGLWRATATVLMLTKFFGTVIHIPHQSDNPTQNAMQAGWSALLYLILMIAMYTISMGYNAYQNRRPPSGTPTENHKGGSFTPH